ncbi:MAG TPA: tetratricopeptide repeat protein [Ktedonobacteraceae bacterium]|nr:tetratricopeptide repeat protein [Ktedonobacteraceae bacterium]
MGNKKRDTRKQKSELANQPVDTKQVQQQLEQYHQVAQALRSTTTPTQVETVITPINEMPEATQVAFLKALTKEGTLDAVDVIQAVNLFATVKETRKAARRALIQLEEVHLYPHWKPPVAPSSVADIDTEIDSSARFWQALITDSRETGEIQLLLFFEQGRNYQDVRMMGFLLEFQHDGVKDFFTRVISKRQAEKQIAQMRSQLSDIKLVNRTLEEGRQLLEEALAINQRFGTNPHPDYRRNLSLIQRLVLNPTASADDDATEDEEDEFEEDEESFNPYMPFSSLLEEVFAISEAGELTASLLNDWIEGDYETVYDQLASDSLLRDNLSREEWIERRRQWHAEASPANFRSTFLRERDSDTDGAPYIIEAGWSFEYNETPLSSEIKELPTATVVYQETGRHWFWTSYIFVEEDDELRLHSMTDEGTALRNLSVEELKTRLDEIAHLASDRLEQLREEAEEEYEDEEDELESDMEEDSEAEEDEDIAEENEDEDFEFTNMATRLKEALQVTTTAMHFADALIAQAPLDSPEIYNTAFDQAEILQDHERAAAYMQLQMERFPDLRAEALQKLAIVHFAISEAYDESEDEEQKLRFFELAEKNLRDSLATNKTAFGLVMLAQTLIAQKKQLDEAEELLRQAQEFETQPKETTLIEVGLGMLARDKEEYEQALLHYQHAADISPDFPGIWSALGQLQSKLEQYEAAEQSLLRALEEDPEQLDAYFTLSSLYMDQLDNPTKAQEILEEGLEEYPDSAELLAALALMYLRNKDFHSAHEYLIEAENIDPELEIVQQARQLYNAEKTAQRQSPKLKFKQHKHKKKR